MAMEARATGSLMQPDEPVQPDLIRAALVPNRLDARGNLMQPDHEPVQLDLIRPEPGPNRLDARLRFSAFLLVLFGSCFIINSMDRASSAQDMVFLGYALFLFGVSLLFMSVMLARSPFAANFAASVVQFIHNFLVGDA